MTTFVNRNALVYHERMHANTRVNVGIEEKIEMATAPIGIMLLVGLVQIASFCMNMHLFAIISPIVVGEIVNSSIVKPRVLLF